jgi:hypothetical protein
MHVVGLQTSHLLLIHTNLGYGTVLTAACAHQGCSASGLVSSISSHDFNVINIGQKLVYPIQLQPFLVPLDPINGAFQSKVEKQW